MGVAIAVNDGVVAAVVRNAHADVIAEIAISAGISPNAPAQGSCARQIFPTQPSRSAI